MQCRIITEANDSMHAMQTLFYTGFELAEMSRVLHISFVVFI
jgi:hypothetical protein